MKNISTFLWIISFALIISACNQEPVSSDLQNAISPSSVEGDIIPDQYIFMFKKETIKPVRDYFREKEFANREEKSKLMKPKSLEVKAEVNSFLKKQGISEESILKIYTAAKAGVCLKVDKTTYERLSLMKEFDAVEYDRIETLPDYEVEEVRPEPSRAQHESCAVGFTGSESAGSSTWIWIVDTGIDTDHPDLNVNTGYGFDATGNNDLQDYCGHGSHVAGIAAAKDNSIGILGVAAGAQVVPAKNSTSCISAPTSNSLACLDHISLNCIPGDVVNLSLSSFFGGGCFTGSAYKDNIDALSDDDVWVVIAAGNQNGLASQYSPGCINNTKVLTVAAMKCNEVFYQKRSNYNMATVDWIAAGKYIKSCDDDGGYRRMSGTSQAAPAVAGICLIRDDHPVHDGDVTYNSQDYPIARID